MTRQIQPYWKIQERMRREIIELGLENIVHATILGVRDVVRREISLGLGGASWKCVFTLLDRNVDPEIILPIKSFAAKLQNQFNLG